MRLKSMNCILATGLAVMAGQAAHATDLSPPPAPMPTKAILSPMPIAFNWTGFYVGVNAGWNWTNTTTVDTGPGVFGAVFPVGTTSSVSRNGFLGGAQVGYNYQINRFVLGVEADFDWSAARLRQDFTGVPNISISYKNRYISTFGARFGYAFDRALLYGKVGGAWTQDDFNVTASDGSAATARFDRWGWMLGVGLEYAVWNNVTLKAEYNYLHFGTKNETFTFNATDLVTGTFTADPNDTKLYAHVVKFGANYLFR